MASAQLQLISTDPVWKLDEQTVETGRAGIAKARAALAAATELKEEFATDSTTELTTTGTLFEYASDHQAAA